MADTATTGGSFWRATLWMLGLSIALSWLPILGPLIAGAVGGRQAGGLGRALLAALLPALLLGALVATLLAAFDLEFLGVLAGLGVGIVVLVQDLMLIGGAALGAATAPR